MAMYGDITANLLINIQLFRKKNCKKINQYSKSNVFIKTYSSIKEASKETGACETTIIPCCRYKRNYSGGFKWYYADDINQPDKTRIIAA